MHTSARTGSQEKGSATLIQWMRGGQRRGPPSTAGVSYAGAPGGAALPVPRQGRAARGTAMPTSNHLRHSLAVGQRGSTSSCRGGRRRVNDRTYAGVRDRLAATRMGLGARTDCTQLTSSTAKHSTTRITNSFQSFTARWAAQ